MSTEVSCFHCGEILKFSGKIGFREDCPKCNNSVHVCKNCDFYDPKAYNECREPQAMRVQEKERANYCDYFTPRKGSAGGSDKNSKDALKAAAEALFKKS